MSNTKRRLFTAALALAGLAWFKLHSASHDDAAAKHAALSPTAVSASVRVARDGPPAITRQLGRIALTPCTLAPDFGVQTVEAQCGSLEVPENRAAPGGRKIRLAVAWLPTKGGESQPDPVVFIAGGPGQSTLEAFPGIANAFAEVRKHRDVLLVDQRGTGGSNKLTCKEPGDQNAAGRDAAGRDAAGGDATVEAAVTDDGAKERDFAIRCAAQLASRADLRFYTTTEAIQDLDAVRAAIGVDKLNLMGVSYGTRVAQQYAKRYPAHVRTITIDGVAPNSLVLGNTMARDLESSLDRQFARCANDKICNDKLGNPRQRLNALMAALRTAPPKVSFRDAITGEMRSETLTPGHIAGLARMFAYVPQAAGLLPLEIDEASKGRYEPLMALANLLRTTVGDQIMGGMQLSVICSEDASELKVEPADADSLLGTAMVTGLQAQCAQWPKGTRPADFRAPLTGKVPVLILSGEFDPVTPPKYGDEVLRTLPNGRHLVVRGQGHNVLPVGCLPKLYARFVETANAKSLDVHCLDKVPYTAPFTGFYGWEP